MSIDSILNVIPAIFKPGKAEPESLDSRDLITLNSSLLVEYGCGVLIGVVTEWGGPDSFGDEWFYVQGIFHNHRTGEMSFDHDWFTRAAVLQVIEL